jgi:hypothetical protein
MLGTERESSSVRRRLLDLQSLWTAAFGRRAVSMSRRGLSEGATICQSGPGGRNTLLLTDS